MSNTFLMVTKILNISKIHEKTGSTIVSIVQKNHLSLIKKIIGNNGSIIHEGTQGNVVTFTDSVVAVAKAAKIMKLSRNIKNSLPPPALAIIIISQKEEITDDIPLLVMNKIELFFTKSGAGDILLSEDVATSWIDRGNRKLNDSPLNYKSEEEDCFLYKLYWDSKTKEPIKSVRMKGTIYASIILIPSIIILIILLFFSINKKRVETKSVLIAGPFYSKYHNLNCGFLNADLIPGNRKIISYCKLGSKGINYHTLKYSSLQITGRVQKKENILILITEIVTLPPEILYNRVISKLKNSSKDELTKVLKKNIHTLIDSYENPVSMSQFEGMFLLCGLKTLPKFAIKGKQVKRMDNFFESYTNTNCVKDIISHLPKGIEGVIK